MNYKNYIISVIVSMIIMGALQACVYNANTIKGDKDIVTREKSLGQFDALHVSGMYNVHLVEGNQPHISITTDNNIQDYVVVEVRSNVLEIGLKDNNSYDPTSLDVYVTVETLSEIKLSGATDLQSEITLKGNNLDIYISGASDMELNVDVDELLTHVSGAGDVELSGNANSHEIKISGAASINCLDLSTLDSDVRISGAGSAKVNVSENLDASVSGVGSIQYTGNPTHKKLNTSGVGSIKSI